MKQKYPTLAERIDKRDAMSIKEVKDAMVAIAYFADGAEANVPDKLMLNVLYYLGVVLLALDASALPPQQTAATLENKSSPPTASN